jgi:hypothetical protein
MCDGRSGAAADDGRVSAVHTTSDSEFQAALSSAELFRQLLESAPDAIVGIGQRNSVDYGNSDT